MATTNGNVPTHTTSHTDDGIHYTDSKQELSRTVTQLTITPEMFEKVGKPSNALSQMSTRAQLLMRAYSYISLRKHLTRETTSSASPTQHLWALLGKFHVPQKAF